MRLFRIDAARTVVTRCHWKLHAEDRPSTWNRRTCKHVRVNKSRTRHPENSKRPRRHGHSARRKNEHTIYHARAKKSNETKRSGEVKVARCSERFALPLADSGVAVVDAGAPSHPERPSPTARSWNHPLLDLAKCWKSSSENIDEMHWNCSSY